MTVKDLLQLCGEKEETEVALYECDEREEVIGFAKTFLTDWRFSKAVESDVASWDYDESDGERILCIYYFRTE